MATKIENGQEVRDTITGFSGIVVATTEWLNGCRRVTVQSPELKDGRPVDTVTFDGPQLELMRATTAFTEKFARPNGGGDQPGPVRAADPR